MAQTTLSIPDAVLQRVLDAYAAVYGWDGVTPPSKAAFMKQQIGVEIRATVRRHEVNLAAAAAQAAIDSEVTIS